MLRGDGEANFTDVVALPSPDAKGAGGFEVFAFFEIHEANTHRRAFEAIGKNDVDFGLLAARVNQTAEGDLLVRHVGEDVAGNDLDACTDWTVAEDLVFEIHVPFTCRTLDGVGLAVVVDGHATEAAGFSHVEGVNAPVLLRVVVHVNKGVDETLFGGK